MSIYDDRQNTKAEDEFYRLAAAQLSGGQVTGHAAVGRLPGSDGAFVEVSVWVPKAEMERVRASIEAAVADSIAEGTKPA